MAAANSNSLCITDVRLFTGHTFISNGYVVVLDGKISQVGEGSPPSSATKDIPVLSKPGHTLIPGLIDGHIHANSGNIPSLEQSIRFGVTTVCDMHNESEFFVPVAQKASDPKNRSIYADFKYCGFGCTVTGGWPAAVVQAFDSSPEMAAIIASWERISPTDPSTAAPHVKAQAAHGASYIKLFHESSKSLIFPELPRPSLEVQRAVVAAAKALTPPLPTVAHALCYDDTLEILSCGVSGLTHTFTDRAPTPELLAAYQKANAHCNPTLAALGSLTTEGKDLQHAFAHTDLAKRLLLPAEPDAQEHLCACMSMSPASATNTVSNAYETVRQLHAAGVPIVAGSDTAGPALGTSYGLSLHMEMWLLRHKCGMSGADVLRSATSVVSERLGLSDRGVLEVGRRGDLVLLKGDGVGGWGEGEGELTLPIEGVWREGVVAEVWKGVMDGKY